MARDKITEYDSTANNNTVCGDVNIAENSALPSDMNNFAREIMSHLKEGLGSGTPLYVDQTNNRLGINTSSPATALDVTGVITTDGMTTSADINFGDSDKAIFGAGSDLQIYHDETTNHSYIIESGTGDLRVLASTFNVRNVADTENMIVATPNGSVDLYYDNALKLTTTSTGIEVTDSVTNTPTINIKSSDTVVVANDVVGAITFEESDATGGTGVQAFIKAIANDSGSTYDMSIGVGGNTEAIRVDQSGNVGIGETSPDAKLHIKTSDNSTQLMLESTDADGFEGPVIDLKRNSSSPADDDNGPRIKFTGKNDAGQDVEYTRVRFNIQDVTDGTEDGQMDIATMINGTLQNRVYINDTGVVINDAGVDSDFRVESDINANAFLVKGDDSNVFMGKNNGSSSVEGARFNVGVNNHITMNGANVILFNRGTNDGQIVGFASQDATQGNISISGSTTSYNAFSASHWSRFTDNSKPTILKGTVIETIDEMMDWYQLTFTVPATDDTPEHSPKISIALEDGQSVGDTITYNHDGTDYQATIIQEGDNKHTKCKISDTADSTRVYGVFADWDNDDDTVNDMYVTAVGTHVVRVHSSATVSAGDLLTSNGDGTAKVQDDDIIRSKTIGKVLTNIVQETYDDGSYTVPCALYCG